MVRRALRPETTDGSAANCHDSSAQPATDDPQGGHKPYRLRGRVKVLGWLIAAVFTAFIGTVNALPPLKVVQLLGNACLSPTTLAPKGPFRPREPKWILLFSLDSVEPHRVNSNDLVGALGAIPTAWWRTSHDVLARLMFSSRADSFSPANRSYIPITKEPIPSYQGPALFQGSFTIIITRLLMPLRWLNGTG